MSQPASMGRAAPLLAIERISALCAAVAVLGMMFIGAFDVIGTALLHQPLPGAYELTESLMVASVFLALALSQRDGRQIRVTLFSDLAGPRMRCFLDVLAELFSIIVYAVIAWYGWWAAAESWQITELSSGLLRFPLWPSRLALALGATLMAVQCVAGLVQAMRPTA